jgi:hypothetical protein
MFSSQKARFANLHGEFGLLATKVSGPNVTYKGVSNFGAPENRSSPLRVVLNEPYGIRRAWAGNQPINNNIGVRDDQMRRPF